MSQAKSIKSNVAIYTLRTLIMSISPLIIFPYVSRVLGAEGVGKIQYSYSIAGYFQLLSALGISSYGIREGSLVKNSNSKLGRLVSELMIINFISSIFSLILYLSIVFFSASLAEYKPYLLLFAIYVVIGGWVLDWFANIKEDFTYITIRSFIFQCLTLLITITAIKKSSDLMVYGIVLMAPSVLTNIFNFFYIKRSVPLFCYPKYDLTKHLKPIFFLFAILISGNVYSLLDSTMLGILANDYSVGLYTAASKYTRLVIQVIIAICTVFLPRLSYYIAQNKKDQFEALFNKAAQGILWISIPCVIGMYMLSDEILILFSGTEFSPASLTMKLLSINIFFSTIDGFLGWQILVPMHKDKFLLCATLLGGCLDIILNIIFIPKYGIAGAAFATVLSEIAVFIVCTFVANQIVSLKALLRKIFKYLIASSSIILIYKLTLVYLPYNAFLVTCITVIISALTYVAILILLKDEITINILNDAMKKLISSKKGDK